jgi:hypothetical protein
MPGEHSKRLSIQVQGSTEAIKSRVPLRLKLFYFYRQVVAESQEL